MKIKINSKKFGERIILIDKTDWKLVSQYRWHVVNWHGILYAITNVMVDGKQNTIKMHRLILKAPRHLQVDHINKNGLDNRRHNIRLCTASQNRYNQKQRKDSSHPFKGIGRWRKRWAAFIRKDGKSIRVGVYDTPIEAAKAYDGKARELFGEFAATNFPTQ